VLQKDECFASLARPAAVEPGVTRIAGLDRTFMHHSAIDSVIAPTSRASGHAITAIAREVEARKFALLVANWKS
jgi:hypothetical protein